MAVLYSRCSLDSRSVSNSAIAAPCAALKVAARGDVVALGAGADGGGAGAGAAAGEGAHFVGRGGGCGAARFSSASSSLLSPTPSKRL